MQRLLSCLAHWCPALAELPELPTVLQPWLVLFGGDQLGAFEACATLLTNWTARFFECHPHPPVAVLASAEAILRRAAPNPNLTPNPPLPLPLRLPLTLTLTLNPTP